ncbi:MAG: hypothetical protein K2X48_16335 [Chitinophagaceae bacterium]|nr:hypothetical protein [Chitinophagaceae bacterium]
MKKNLLGAVALFGFLLANAQNEQVSVSTATNTLAGPVTGELDVKLIIHNIIRIRPDNAGMISATFDQASELDNGLSLGGRTFRVSSNRPFVVSLGASPIVKTNDYASPGYPVPQMPMPLSVIETSVLTFGQPGMAVAAAYNNSLGNWGPLAASIPNLVDSWHGAARDIGLSFRANPGWNYEGGVYTTTVTVTATQR